MSSGDLNWIANYVWGIAGDGLRDPRFVIEHAGDSEYSPVTRSTDILTDGPKEDEHDE